MQVNRVEAAPLTPSLSPVARIVAGDATALPIGELLEATVTRVAGEVAELLVNGKPVTVSGAGHLRPGLVHVVRVPAAGSLELLPSPPSALAETVAATAAVLRAPRPPDLGALLGPLLAELAAPQPELRDAAQAVREVLETVLPKNGQSPNAAELRALVENGGLQHEAKLARTEGHPVSLPPDLKGKLLELLGAADRSGTAERIPAARVLHELIVAQQAVNALAQVQGAPYFLQLPLPDGDDWRTVYLAIEKEQSATESAEGFRVLLHADLADLGETWVDAGIAGRQLRAAIYAGDSAQDRFRAALPGLRQELHDLGFAEVLLDVRPRTDLSATLRQRGAAMVAGLPEEGHVLDAKA